MNAERIQAFLKNKKYSVHYAESTDSTNEWAKREAVKGAPDYSVYIADTQTAGKGSRGRSWESPEGTSVSMSIILRPDIPVQKVSMLTLVMGMAAADGMRDVSGLDTKIKWPNDVVYNRKKLCGILTEMGNSHLFVVPGIGLNVNQVSFPDELSDKATSLRIEKGSPQSRDETAAAVLNRFDDYYGIFLKTGDLSGLIGHYQEMLINRNEPVHVVDTKEPFDGTALGIDENGDLLIRRSDSGETVRVFSGEVSVRGLYSYA